MTHYSDGTIKGGSYVANQTVAIDLIHSKVEIDQCLIQDTNENGLSVGEESKVKVKYIEIKDTLTETPIEATGILLKFKI